MKKILALQLMVMASLASWASDRGGDSFRLPRGSAAWVVSESLEHSMRLLYQAGLARTVDSAEVVYNPADQSSLVTITQAGETVEFSCVTYDHLSRGGSVVKKEILCRRAL